MIPLTNEENQSYQEQKASFMIKKDYKFIKSEIIVFRLETKEVLLITFVI